MRPEPAHEACGYAPLTEMRDGNAVVMTVAAGAPLESSGLRLLSGRPGLRHAARGVSRLRRGRSRRAMGGARFAVHQGFQGGARGC